MDQKNFHLPDESDDADAGDVLLQDGPRFRQQLLLTLGQRLRERSRLLHRRRHLLLLQGVLAAAKGQPPLRLLAARRVLLAEEHRVPARQSRIAHFQR